MKRYSNDPMMITARFNSTCSETGKLILKGDTVLYYPISRKVYKLSAEKAIKAFKEWKQDIDELNQNY